MAGRQKSKQEREQQTSGSPAQGGDIHSSGLKPRPKPIVEHGSDSDQASVPKSKPKSKSKSKSRGKDSLSVSFVDEQRSDNEDKGDLERRPRSQRLAPTLGGPQTEDPVLGAGLGFAAADEDSHDERERDRGSRSRRSSSHFFRDERDRDERNGRSERSSRRLPSRHRSRDEDPELAELEKRLKKAELRQRLRELESTGKPNKKKKAESKEGSEKGKESKSRRTGDSKSSVLHSAASSQSASQARSGSQARSRAQALPAQPLGQLQAQANAPGQSVDFKALLEGNGDQPQLSRAQLREQRREVRHGRQGQRGQAADQHDPSASRSRRQAQPEQQQDQPADPNAQPDEKELGLMERYRQAQENGFMGKFKNFIFRILKPVTENSAKPHMMRSIAGGAVLVLIAITFFYGTFPGSLLIPLVQHIPNYGIISWFGNWSWFHLFDIPFPGLDLILFSIPSHVFSISMGGFFGMTIQSILNIIFYGSIAAIAYSLAVGFFKAVGEIIQSVSWIASYLTKTIVLGLSIGLMKLGEGFQWVGQWIKTNWTDVDSPEWYIKLAKVIVNGLFVSSCKGFGAFLEYVGLFFTALALLANQAFEELNASGEMIAGVDWVKQSYIHNTRDNQLILLKGAKLNAGPFQGQHAHLHFDKASFGQHIRQQFYSIKATVKENLLKLYPRTWIRAAVAKLNSLRENLGTFLLGQKPPSPQLNVLKVRAYQNAIVIPPAPLPAGAPEDAKPVPPTRVHMIRATTKGLPYAPEGDNDAFCVWLRLEKLSGGFVWVPFEPEQELIDRFYDRPVGPQAPAADHDQQAAAPQQVDETPEQSDAESDSSADEAQRQLPAAQSTPIRQAIEAMLAAIPLEDGSEAPADSKQIPAARSGSQSGQVVQIVGLGAPMPEEFDEDDGGEESHELEALLSTAMPQVPRGRRGSHARVFVMMTTAEAVPGVPVPSGLVPAPSTRTPARTPAARQMLIAPATSNGAPLSVSVASSEPHRPAPAESKSSTSSATATAEDSDPIRSSAAARKKPLPKAESSDGATPPTSAPAATTPVV